MKTKTYTVTVEGITRREYRLTGKIRDVIETAKRQFICDTVLHGTTFSHVHRAVADKKEE